MKKQILTLVMLLGLGLSSVFANDAEGVSDKVIKSFKKEFASAQEVQWEKSKDFVKVTFKLNDQIMFGYYNEEGEMIALTRNITSVQLPINLLADIKKNYSQFWITDLFEIAMNNATDYYITVENSDFSIVLKSSGAQAWEVFKKERKSIAL